MILNSADMYSVKKLHSPHRRKAAEFIKGTKDMSNNDKLALIKAAEDIDIQLRDMGVVGGIAALTAGGVGLTADILQEDDSNILINPVTSAAVLTGIGGLSGHELGVKNAMHNRPVDTQGAKLNSLHRARRGSAIGAGVGGGAGLLLSLMGSLEDEGPMIYD